MFRCFWGWLFLLLAPAAVFGGDNSLLSEYTIRRWAVEDGLPEATITTVQQLQDGYLWCTTPRHVVRFDGVRFVVVGTAQDGGALPGLAAGVYQDVHGTLWWYGSAGALRCESNRWLPIGTPGLLALGEIDNQLWAATTTGMRWWDGNAFHGGGTEPVVTADVDARGRFWLAVGGKLASFDDGKLRMTDLPKGDVSQVSVSPSGEFWVQTSSELYRRQPGGWRSIPLPAPERQVTSLLVEDDGTLWLGTTHALYRRQNENWSELTAREGLFPWDIRSLAPDREGNVWVGTSGGLVRLRRKSLTVVRTGRPHGSETVTAFLAESATNVWEGVPDGGLLAGPPGNLRPVSLGKALEDMTVSALCRGREGSLWVGTQADGLWRCGANGSATAVPSESSAAQGISSLLEDRRGRLWAGTWGGLLTLDATGALVPTNVVSTADTVHALYEDRASRVWVGFQTLGLVCVSPDGTVRRYRRADGLPGDSVRTVLEDSEGKLWVGTTSGLGCWADGRWHTFTTMNGLVDNVIVQLVQDSDGYLWLGTPKGIMRIRMSEFADVSAGRKVVLATRSFGAGAGMAATECSGGMGALPARTGDGRLWFPTVDGLVVVDPRHLRPEVAKPEVYIEEIDAGGQSVYRSPVATATPPLHIELQRGVRELEVQVTTPVLSSPERANFKYRLEGRDKDWSRATTERFVRYDRLAPGTYRFHAEARDRDGDWNWSNQSVAITVVPFVWETTWFRAGAVSFGLLGVVLLMHLMERRRTADELDELKRRYAIERERTRIARDIHDDVGAGLTEVAMLSELAREDAGPTGEVSDHLDRIFRRARDITRSLDEIVWAINPANDTMESFVLYVSEFAQGFLATAGLVCRLELPANLPSRTMSTNVRHHLCLAIREALHNVVKHADASEVHLRIEPVSHQLRIIIRDNGRGFVTEAEPGVGTGHDGLTNLSNRMTEIGGMVVYHSEPGRGTEVVLSVELAQAGTSVEAHP
ncbi:MAG TPA: two-component regulator propeller domain-containing protein [Verrucomicrobiae bacterium]|nr:two-component regulator propeller domain-containing protein [Verrucomicrobiae bacterium]